MGFWMTKWTNSCTGVCTDDWVTDWLSANMSAFWLHNHPALNLVNMGHCFDLRMVTAWLYFPCCDSRYSPPARLPVEWQIFKIRESLVLHSHRPLLADGSIWNIAWGMQVFPARTAGRWVMWRPSWTALKQLAVTDGPKGCLPLPSGINTFFFFLERSAVQLWEIMWGVSRSQSLKWYTVNWHSASEWKSNASIAFYVDVN